MCESGPGTANHLPRHTTELPLCRATRDGRCKLFKMAYPRTFLQELHAEWTELGGQGK